MLANVKIEQYQTRFKEKGQLAEVALLTRMTERAERDPSYREAMNTWLTHGGTQRIRELCKPFGNYWNCLSFANKVDSLDAISLYHTQGKND